MRHYKIFEHPAGNIEAVKLGWSWPAFFFDVIWALFKKMWWLGGCVLVVFFCFGFFGVLAGPIDGLTTLAGIVLKAVFGVNGNRWRENKLQLRGYHYKETISAANPEGATALYLQQQSNLAVQLGAGRL